MPTRPQHYGWLVSPYSAKTRAWLTHAGVDFDDVHPTVRTLRRRIAPAVGRFIMPTVELPTGEWLQDSSLILDHFAAGRGTPPLWPHGRTQRLAAALLEVFADEWMPMVALHTRWNHPENTAFALTEFARTGFPLLPPAIGRRLIRPFADRMQGYLAVLGVDDETVPGVEETLRLTLESLETTLAEHPFVLGHQPCMADVALYGPLWAHVYRDPASRGRFDPLPRVRAWLERLTTGAPAAGGFLPGDAVPRSLDRLFGCILVDQWSWIGTVVAAINTWCAQHPDAERVPRSLGPAPVAVRGRTGTRKQATFVQWKAQRALAAHAAAHGDADPWLNRVWQSTGQPSPRRPFPTVMHPFEIRSFRTVLAARPA